MSHRKYPVLAPSDSPPSRPLSLVVVHYSDDYFHNILRSDCVHDPLNQLVRIDNRNNLFYDNLTRAINAGIDQARHELVAIVHEDILLPQGWHRRLERSLADLEQFDPDWGLLGSAGWTIGMGEAAVGHWSDPYTYSDTLQGRSFERVRTIDEQLMILRRTTGIRFDAWQPSIHRVGNGLASTLKGMGLGTYVINAPTIHKYSDDQGNRIEGFEDSPKIEARKLPSYLADWACCEEYLYRTWPEWRPEGFEEPDFDLTGLGCELRRLLPAPVVLLSRGGSGSRLLVWLAQDLGLFVGNDVNLSGDAMEMVRDLYMGVLNHYQYRAAWQKELIVPRIRLAAARMLERAGSPSPWGFKLPEGMLIVPQIDRAFADARYVHLIRDPLTTSLRRTHMTARFDNTIGRVAIRAAYRYCSRDPAASLEDSPAVRMAYTTIHQVETVRDHARRRLGDRYLEVRFEELLEAPRRALEQVGGWLGTKARGGKLEREIDPERAAQPAAEYCYPPEVERTVAGLLAPLRCELGYL